MNLENLGLSLKNLEPIRIRQLDLNTSNQIAAGEVIERPSSAVKELVENSIDAGANSIDILYANGGKSFLSVKDNGHGINKEDLSLALSRHATSKINTIGDLTSIKSLGFRGEALASIGSVSELTIKSKFIAAGETFEISSSYGEATEVKPSQYLEGTLIEIKNLFQSIPARLKFLKTDRAEGISILEVVKNLSLSNPEISFKLYEIKDAENPREILRLEGSTDTNDSSQRIKEVLKNAFMENSHQVDYKNESIKITGYISSPTFVTGNAKNCYFFVNGRFVRDRSLLRYTKMAYGDLLEKAGFPSAVLFLDVQSQEIDINVHPTKNEIRLFRPNIIRDNITRTIKAILANKHNVMMTADSQSSSQFGNISRFKGMKLISPTEREARIACRNNEDGLIGLTEKLREESRHTGTISEASLLFGAHYRLLDAIAPSFGVDFGDYMLLLSYDFNTSKLANATRSKGAFELTLRYRNPELFSKGGGSFLQPKFM